MLNPTTRQEVIEATDEQLNEWAATVVMGWRPAKGYDGYICWFGADGCFCAGPSYMPATDIAQATGLVEALPKCNVNRAWTDIFVIFVGNLMELCGGGFIDLIGNMTPRAITQACIMTKLGL